MEQKNINALIHEIADKNNSGWGYSVQVVSLSSFTGLLNRNTPTSGSLILLLNKSTRRLSTFSFFKGNNLNPCDVHRVMYTEH